MDKSLYYFNWHLPAYISGVVASDMEQQIEAGNEVLLLSCRGVLKPCWNNMEARESVCRACRFNQRSNVVFNHPKVKTLYIDDLLSSQELEKAFVSSRLMDYHDIESIKDLQYEGMELGYGALSSYISYTRNSDPLVDDAFRDYFNRLLISELAIAIALEKVVDAYNIKKFVIFNGRLHDVRPVLYYAEQRKMPIRVLESIRVSKDETRSTEFPGVLPQSIDYRFALVEKTWKEAPFSESEKIEIAKQFFEKRRNNLLTQDVKVYTENQEQGLLPLEWNGKQRNIVIFSSSEFESAAIGRLREGLSLIGSQLEGVRHICNQLKGAEHTKIYVRVHPNLKDCGYRYHMGLYDLQKEYSNLIVITPESPISTYALIDAMDLGITFGSTAGLEACVSNKPVILLKGCYYYHFNATYNPKSVEELNQLLKLERLEPKDKLGAYKYGFYLAYPKAYTEKIKYEVKSLRYFGREIYQTPHLRVMNNSWIYKVLWLILNYCNRLIINEKKLVVPLVEQEW